MGEDVEGLNGCRQSQGLLRLSVFANHFQRFHQVAASNPEHIGADSVPSQALIPHAALLSLDQIQGAVRIHLVDPPSVNIFLEGEQVKTIESVPSISSDSRQQSHSSLFSQACWGSQ